MFVPVLPAASVTESVMVYVPSAVALMFVFKLPAALNTTFAGPLHAYVVMPEEGS